MLIIEINKSILAIPITLIEDIKYYKYYKKYYFQGNCLRKRHKKPNIYIFIVKVNRIKEIDNDYALL